MFDIIEFIGTLFNLSWRHFLWLIAAFAVLAACALIAELWPFDNDKTQVINWSIRISMMLAFVVYGYVRFFRKTRGGDISKCDD